MRRLFKFSGRSWTSAILASVLVMCSATLSAAETTKERWYVVRVDGKKMGHQRSITRISAERVRQTEILDIEMDRGGEKAALFSESMTEETPAGKPIGFAVRFRASAQETLTQGKLRADGQIELIETVDQKARTPRLIALEPGALFPHGTLLKLRQAGLKPGSVVDFLAFDPTVMASMKVHTKVLSKALRQTVEGELELLEVQQIMSIAGTQVESNAWVNANFDVYEMQTNIGGLSMQMLLSTRASALADNETANYFLEQFVRSPRALGAQEQRDGLSYTIKLGKNAGNTALPQTDEQDVQQTAEGLQVNICERCGNAPEAERSAKNLREFSQASAWLQSDDPVLKQAAVKQIGTAKTELEKMQRLQEFVSAHISESNLSTGYASAKEAFENRTGDCTEHALLLAAMARAVGIPSRVVGGLAYSPEYLGQNSSFIPHAWTQAYVGGRWRSFDAALGEFDAGHIALSITDGSPTSSFAGAALLGNVQIQSVQAIPQNVEK